MLLKPLFIITPPQPVLPFEWSFDGFEIVGLFVGLFILAWLLRIAVRRMLRGVRRLR